MKNIDIVNNVPGIHVAVNSKPDGGYVVSISKEIQERLCKIPCGQAVKIGDREFIVLEQREGCTAVITKDFVTEMKFDGNGDWSISPIRRYLNTKFRNELVAAIGKDGIIKRCTDIIADDSSTNVCHFDDFVTLLTYEEYCKYREHLRCKLPSSEKPWWLMTCNADTAKGRARCVCYVYSYSALAWHNCGEKYGIRPFCLLNSDILVKTGVIK